MDGFQSNIRGSVYKALANPDSFGMTILVAAAHVIPLQDLLAMSLDTVVLELKEQINVDLTDTLQLAKLQACTAILSDPGVFYEDVVGFIDICNVLSGSDIDPDVFDPADPLEMAWAVTEAKILDPPDPSEPSPWSDDVRTYVGTALIEFGHVKPPQGLEFAAIPENVNPALALADQPDLVAAAVGKQDSLGREIEAILQERMKMLAMQLEPFQKAEQPTV
jgi:hypothetical protein